MVMGAPRGMAVEDEVVPQGSDLADGVDGNGGVQHPGIPQSCSKGGAGTVRPFCLKGPRHKPLEAYQRPGSSTTSQPGGWIKMSSGSCTSAATSKGSAGWAAEGLPSRWVGQSRVRAARMA